LAVAREQLKTFEEENIYPIQDIASAAGMKPSPLERILVKDGSKVHVIPVDKNRLHRSAG